MKVLMINGSPRPHGCTATAMEEMGKVFQEKGIDYEIVTVGNKDIRGCIACLNCKKNGKCVFNDLVNEVAEKLAEADGVVLGSPVYFASANGTLISFLDRLFYSTPFSKRMKVGAAITSSRRAGNTATFDILNKYFTINEMPIASGRYWNEVHGYSKEDALSDAEGMQNMRFLAENMAFLMQSIQANKEALEPHNEKVTLTNFIR